MPATDVLICGIPDDVFSMPAGVVDTVAIALWLVVDFVVASSKDVVSLAGSLSGREIAMVRSLSGDVRPGNVEGLT